MVLHTQPDRYRTRLTDGICVRAHIARSIENDVTLSFRTAFSSSSFFPLRRVDRIASRVTKSPVHAPTRERERGRLRSTSSFSFIFFCRAPCLLGRWAVKRFGDTDEREKNWKRKERGRNGQNCSVDSSRLFFRHNQLPIAGLPSC